MAWSDKDTPAFGDTDTEAFGAAEFGDTDAPAFGDVDVPAVQAPPIPFSPEAGPSRDLLAEQRKAGVVDDTGRVLPEPMGEFEKGLRSGWAGVKQSTAASAYLLNVQGNRATRTQMGVWDRIDRGEPVAMTDDWAGYAAAPPDIRAKMRADAQQVLDDSVKYRQGISEAWKAFSEEAKQYQGKVTDLRNIEDVATFKDWLKFQAGNLGPSMASMAGGGIVGGAVSGAPGAFIGVAVPALALDVGEIQSDLMEAGHGDRTDLALAYGIPSAALDTFSGGSGRVVRAFAKDLPQKGVRAFARQLPGDVLHSMGEEAAQEGAQEALGVGATSQAEQKNPLTTENAWRIVNASAAGAIGGGMAAPAGTAIETLAGQKERPAEPTPDERFATEMMAANSFVATPDWQEVPAGAQVPSGMDIRVDPATGRQWARVRPTPTAAAPAVPDLAASMKDSRSAEQIATEQQAQQQQAATDEGGRALSAFGVAKGDRVAMTYGSITAPVTIDEAWEEDGATWARVRDDGGTTYVLQPGEADFSPIVGDGTRAAPVQATTATHVDEAAKQTAEEPTEAQKAAGNYRKGHVKVHGLDVAIENARGSTRAGVDPDGKPWSVEMPTHYGYIKRSTGADGDQVDVYLGPNLDSDKVFVVDQIHPANGEFDEHKVMLGYPDSVAAMLDYQAAFSDGRGMERAGSVTPMSVAEFKAWMAKGDTTKPLTWRKPEAPQPFGAEDAEATFTDSAAPEGGASPEVSAEQQPEAVGGPSPAAPSEPVSKTDELPAPAVKESLRADSQPEAAAAPGGLSQESGAALPAESVPNEPTPPAHDIPDEWHGRLLKFGQALLDGRSVHAAERHRLWSAFRGFVAHDPDAEQPFAKPADVDLLAEDYARDPGGYFIDRDRLPAWLHKTYADGTAKPQQNTQQSKRAAEAPPRDEVSESVSAQPEQKQTAPRQSAQAVEALMQQRTRSEIERGLADMLGKGAEPAMKEAQSTATPAPMPQKENSAIVSPEEFSLDLARRAYEGISHTPERRAEQERDEFVRDVQDLHDRLSAMAETDEQKTVLAEQIASYKAGYLAKRRTVLEAKSRVMSSMIVGPAKFPAERNKKRMATEMRRAEEFSEWRIRAQKAVEKAIFDVRTGEQVATGEWAKLKKAIDENMGIVAAIDRRDYGVRGFSRPAFVNSTVNMLRTRAEKGEVEMVRRALAHIREAQAGMEKPFITEKHSVWGLAEQAQEKKTEQVEKADLGPLRTIAEYDGVEVIDHANEERIRLHFDGKPPADVIAALKKAGWRWSPANSAWQRQNTNAAAYSATSILDKFYTRKATETPEMEPTEASQEEVAESHRPTTEQDAGEVKSWSNAAPGDTTSSRDPAMQRGQDSGDHEGEVEIAKGLMAVPAERFSEHEAELVAEINDLAERLVPKARVRIYRRMRATDESGLSGNVLGAHWKTRDGRIIAHVVALALESEAHAQTLRHEAIHYLRSVQLLDDQEYGRLRQLAEREGWIERHDISARYPDIGYERILEEAIAEQFSKWRATSGENVPAFIRPVFNRIRLFLDKVADIARRILGKDATADDIFARIERGEVGRRGVVDEIFRDTTGVDFAHPQTEAVADEALSFLIRRPPPPAGPAVPGENTSLMPDAGWLKRMFVHPRTVAALHKAFVPVYRTAEKQFETRDEVAAALSRMIEPYTALTAEQKRKVNAVLELGRLQGTVIRSNQLTAVQNTGHPDARLSKQGDIIRLNGEEQAAYKAVRTAMDAALELFKQQVIRERGLDPAVVKTARDIEALASVAPTPTEQAHLTEVAQTVRDIEQAKRQGYIPFQRWGQVGIIVKKDTGQVDPATGEIIKDTVWFEMIEVDGLLDRAERWTNEKLKRPTNFASMPQVAEALNAVKRKYQGKPGFDIKVVQIAPNTPMASQVHIADLDMLAQVAQLDPMTWDSVKDAFDTAIMKRSFRSHFFGAKNTPGYSGDFERAIADYVVGISGYLARRRFASTWERAIEAIPRAMPKLKEYAQKYHAYIQNPAEEFFALRQIGFVWYLAGSLATAMVNLTQVPIITAPYLTQFHGKAGVVRELTLAYRDALKMMTKHKGMDIFDPSKAPADVAVAMQKAWDEGFFVPLNTWEVMGLAHNRSPALRGLSKKARTAVDAIAIMFTMAERMNRLVTFIAAYRLGRSPAVMAKASQVLSGNALARSGELLRGFTPEKFAEWVIDETHYRMGKVNRPTVMRGTGAALLQFKGFTMQTLELFYRLGAQNGRDGKVAMGLMLMMLWMFSGNWGLPFADDITDLLESLSKKFGGVDVDIRTKFRELVVELTGSPKLAEFLGKGGGRLIGMDLSRIGMGHIIPHDMEEVGGIPASMTVGRLSQTMEHAKHGDTALAVGELLPVFAKNIIHGAAWGTSGVRSQTSGKMVITPEEVTVGQQMLKAIGFTPAAIANRRESEYAQQRANKASTDVKSEFYSRLARLHADQQKAMDAGDKETVDRIGHSITEVMDELNAFNSGRPDHEQVKIDRKQMQSKIREELMGARARDKAAPKAARARRQQIDEIYGTTD